MSMGSLPADLADLDDGHAIRAQQRDRARTLHECLQNQARRPPSEQSANGRSSASAAKSPWISRSCRLRSWQASDMPWTCSAMPELMSGGTMVPTKELLPRIDEAIWSGTKPTPSATFMMRASVAGASLPGLRNARDTVIGDSPEALAIVRTLCGESAERLRFFLAAMTVHSRGKRGGLRTCLFARLLCARLFSWRANHEQNSGNRYHSL